MKFHELFSHKPKTFGANTASVLRKAVKDYLEIGGFPEVQKLDRNPAIPAAKQLNLLKLLYFV